MRILLVILILSVCAIIWAAWSIARHVRRDGEQAAPPESSLLGLVEQKKDSSTTDASD
jgi:hypothetical protein